MKGMVRSIHYWIYMAEKVFLASFCAIIAVIFMAALLGNESDMLYGTTMPYILMLGVMVLIVQGFNNPAATAVQALLNGSTRKELFAGMLISSHVIGIQTVLLLALSGGVIKQMGKENYIYLDMAVYVIILTCVIAFGTLTSAVVFRFGRRKAVVLYFVFVLAAVGFVVLGFDFLKGINVFMGFIVSAVFDIAASLVCYFAIRKLELRI